MRGDLTAGLTVAAYLVPQVIAYATVAGLPPVTGLWTALAALVGYALLGTSRLLSIGPDYPDARRLPGLVVYRYDAPLSFANADNFRRRALAAVDASPTPARWLILNTEAIVELDITAADALRNLNDELRSRDIVLALARVKQDLRTDLRRTGLLEAIGPDRIFPTLPTAVAAFRGEHPPPEGADLPEGG